MAPPAGHIRPGRYLGFFLLIIVVLYALVFLTGDGKPTPKLGIDLQGGTRVTLTAHTPDGREPSKESLDQAREIIETRVNGLGVSGAEVVLDGNNIRITVPGEEGDQAKLLGQTAKLGLREVIHAQPANAPPGQQQPGQQPGQSGQPGQQQPGQQQPGQEGTPQGRVAPAPDSGTEPQAAPQSTNPQSTSPQSAASSAADTRSGTAPQSDAGQARQPEDPSPPGGDESSSANQRQAEEIKKAKHLRQSQNPQTQQLALAQLDCSAQDPLRGNDDPKRPLVACSQDGKEKFVLGPVFIDGQQISDANAQSPSQGSPGFVVTLDFKDKASSTWAKFTSENVGKRAAFVLDTEVVSAPSINGPIPGGQTEISGDFTNQQAQDLASVLKYGSLPLSFDSSDAATVSATLGLASLQAGLIAGGIGLALVVLYCLFYYRMLGLLTVLSLVLSFAIVYGVLVLLGRWMGYSLDLAGVAGLIIAIGITADSFVIFFERLKDEVREGRTFRSAVPRGWLRARRTILSADAVSFLGAVVLWILALGEVRGFAFTLGLSTVLDLIVVFLVTHPLVVLAAKSKTLSSPRFSGLGGVQQLAAQRRAAKRTGAAVKEA